MVMGKVTLQQIADLSGVSKFAVSRALSGKPGVGQQTKERIFKIAAQLGYFNANSRGLEEAMDNAASASEGTIAILFPNIRFQNRESLFWGLIYDGITERLKQKGLQIITITEPGDSIFHVVNPKGIAGMICVGTISTQLIVEIRNAGIPIVMIDYEAPGYTCDTVFANNFDCMRELTAKLIAKGYRDFQYVGNIEYARSFYDRWLGFRTTLDAFEISLVQSPVLTDLTIGNHVEVRETIRTLERLPEIFVCANDSLAYNVIAALRERGVDVPSQCAVSGFDDTEESTHNQPMISTVHVPKQTMGMRAVDRLIWRIANPDAPPEKTLIHGDVILRESTERKS